MHLHICFDIVQSLKVFPTGKGFIREELSMEECFVAFFTKEGVKFLALFKLQSEIKFEKQVLQLEVRNNIEISNKQKLFH
jgi:hypothetical protein